MEKPDLYFEIAELFTKFLEGKLSTEESEKLNKWIAEDKAHQRLWEDITNPEFLENRLQHWENSDLNTSWTLLHANLFAKGKPYHKKLVFKKVMRYAAIFIPALFLLGVGWYLFGNNGTVKQSATQTDLTGVHILPKGKIARLVLGNGKVVQLAGGMKTDILQKDGTRAKNTGNAIHYLAGRQEADAGSIYNTLLTPKGGEYQVVLSDGTKVWLNAASSLRFPTRFTGDTRKVYLTGEAYFEVGQDPAHPFVVRTDGMDVTVLGTSFDVASYPDEPAKKAVLVDGAIKIENTKSGLNKVLKPGYEALINPDESHIHVQKANVAAALSWKNGLFIFDSESLGSIMRTLTRWYDVDIVYSEGVDTLFHFTGRIKRYENITGILHLIEITQKVSFVVEGRNIKVMPWNDHDKS